MRTPSVVADNSKPEPVKPENLSKADKQVVKDEEAAEKAYQATLVDQAPLHQPSDSNAA